MRVFKFLCVFFLFSVKNFLGQEVIELDDSSFKTAIEDSNGLWLIYFYAVFMFVCTLYVFSIKIIFVSHGVNFARKWARSWKK